MLEWLNHNVTQNFHSKYEDFLDFSIAAPRPKAFAHSQAHAHMIRCACVLLMTKHACTEQGKWLAQLLRGLQNCCIHGKLCFQTGWRQLAPQSEGEDEGSFLPFDELAKAFKTNIHVMTHVLHVFLQRSSWHAKLYLTSHPKPRKDGAVFVKWVPGWDPLHKHF